MKKNETLLNLRPAHEMEELMGPVPRGFLQYGIGLILLVLLCQSGEEQTGRAYAVTKDYVMFAVIGVASLLFMIIGFATMSSKMNEMKKLFDEMGI